MIKPLLISISIAALSLPVHATDFTKLVAGQGGYISSTNKPISYTYANVGDTISLEHFSKTIPFCAMMYVDDLENSLAYGYENLTIGIERDGLIAVSCAKNSSSLFGHDYLYGIFSE